MNWIAWTLIGGIAVGQVANISMIGRKREPVTPGQAVFSLALAGLYVWGIAVLATGGGAS